MARSPRMDRPGGTSSRNQPCAPVPSMRRLRCRVPRQRTRLSAAAVGEGPSGGVVGGVADGSGGSGVLGAGSGVVVSGAGLVTGGVEGGAELLLPEGRLSATTSVTVAVIRAAVSVPTTV